MLDIALEKTQIYILKESGLRFDKKEENTVIKNYCGYIRLWKHGRLCTALRNKVPVARRAASPSAGRCISLPTLHTYLTFGLSGEKTRAEQLTETLGQNNNRGGVVLLDLRAFSRPSVRHFGARLTFHRLLSE